VSRAAYSVREEPSCIKPGPAPRPQASPAQPQAPAGERDAGAFLSFVRKHSLPLAAQLEHGHLRLRGADELVIEFPPNSFYLENIKDPDTQKKIKQLGEEFYQRTLRITAAAGYHGAAASAQDDREQERKKKRQEALRNPLVQKIIDVFDGEIIEVRTEGSGFGNR
jgi:hypothetical protein